jgi:predicted TIM-barrel fold metal-dependent hydrolase
VIVDAHVHLVAADEARYPLQPKPLSGPWYREAPCSAEQFAGLMDEAGVGRALLVQPLGAYSYDNRYAADSAARVPERFASVCCVDPEGPDPPAELAYWVRERGMRGVRLFALSRGPSWLGGPRAIALLERAAELGVHPVVTIFTHQLPELRALLERFPALPFSLDHCGFPELAGEPWREAAPLFSLAELPNLSCKLTTHVLDRAARCGEPQSFVRALVDQFGAGRVMWGSDFAQTHDRPYAELVRLGRAACAELSADEQAACLGGTALRCYSSASSWNAAVSASSSPSASRR